MLSDAKASAKPWELVPTASHRQSCDPVMARFPDRATGCKVEISSQEDQDLRLREDLGQVRSFGRLKSEGLSLSIKERIMIRTGFLRLPYQVALAALMMSATSVAGGAEGATFRDLVRKYNKDGNGKTLAQSVGLSKPVEQVVALEYTVLLRSDGNEQAVDPRTHRFRIGDQIRIRVQPVGDVYLYVFHEGASGQRLCLLPIEQEKVPFVGAGKVVNLPDDGYFEFDVPPGNEELLVVATEKPTADLAALSNVVFKKPESELTPQEKDIKKTLKASVQKTLQSIRERQNESTNYRGLLDEDAMKSLARKVESSGATRTVIEEPPTRSNSSTFASVIDTQPDVKPNLLISIPLKSMAKSSGSK